MSLNWIRENPPTWDDDKDRIVGDAAERAAVPLQPPAEGLVLGEWWRVEQGGEVVGYGWMDVVWGEGEILLAVDETAQKSGVGSFIIDQLEREAASRGLRYIYNTVRPEHPQHEQVSQWLQEREFAQAGDDERLVRKVKP